MASESLERALQVGGVATVVETAPLHDPAPNLALVVRPDGLGSAALVKVDEHRWEVVRFEGPTEAVARHRFASLASFVRWLSRWGSSWRAQVFADLNAKPPTATAVLDPHDPKGDEVACEVAYSPGFRAWVIETAGKRLDQRALFALVRGHGGELAGEHAAENLLGSLAALRVVGETTLESELAANGRTIVSGVRGGVRVTGELPGEIELRLPIYDGVDRVIPATVEGESDSRYPATYPLRALLDVEVNPAAGISVGISFPALSVAMSAAGDDLVAHLERELGEGWLVCLGKTGALEVPIRRDMKRIGKP